MRYLEQWHSILLKASQPIHQFVVDNQQAYLTDPSAQSILQRKLASPQGHKHYTLVDSQLMYKGRNVCPGKDNWRQEVIQEFHGGVVGGHPRRSRTYMRVIKNFAWPGLQNDVKKFVVAYAIC